MIISAAAVELEEIVAAYESAVRADPTAEIASFLPPADSGLYAAALRELVRVDMELASTAGRRRDIDYYLRNFPSLERDPEALREIRFEEQRLRDSRGEPNVPRKSSDSAAIDRSGWPRSSDGLVASAKAYLHGQQSTAVDRLTAQMNGKNADLATQLFADVHGTDPKAAQALAESLTKFPQVGDAVLGFQLLDELGRGAFGRVYLAREGAVDGRRVALKVTGDARAEVRALARLRHTNIVPVYSVQSTGPYQVICMPYCGSVTLAEVIRAVHRDNAQPSNGQRMVDCLRQPRGVSSNSPLLVRLAGGTFVGGVLELAVRLASGLAHAHDQGICHRDLKPANILIADDGEPLLLDFNLAAQVPTGASAAAALVGGTLPYMAPEQLRAFNGASEPTDARADVYSFGLILYEWLIGHLPTPVPSGVPASTVVARLIAERSVTIDLANLRMIASPALASIVAKCLQAEPANRYSSARELADDLVRQRDHQPLRYAPDPSWRERGGKWAARHPRLSSGTAVAVVATTVLAVAGLLGWNIARDRTALAARENVRLFHEEAQAAHLVLARPDPNPEELRKGIDLGFQAWNRIPANSRELDHERASLALLLARAEWQRTGQPSAAWEWNQRADDLLDGSSPAVDLQRQLLKDPAALDVMIANRSKVDSELDFLSALVVMTQHRPTPEVLRACRRETQHDPGFVNGWHARGWAEYGLGLYRSAARSFSTCIALQPRVAEYYHGRALACMALGRHTEALNDLERTLKLDSTSLAALVDRGLAKLNLNDLAGAEADVTAAIDGGFSETRLYFLRARIRDRQKNSPGGQSDRAMGFEREPVTENDWLARAAARLPDRPQAALMDLDACLQRFPRSRSAWVSKANIFAGANRTAEAVRALDEAIRLAPASAVDFAARGVLLARLGRFPEARRDASQALELGAANAELERDEQFDVTYQVAGIFALTSQDKPADRDRAIFLLSRAIHNNYGLELVDGDPELKDVRILPEVRKLLKEAKSLSH